LNRAFCVGINEYPIDGAGLEGCANDAPAWAALLTEHFDFLPVNVATLTNSRATRASIIDGSKHLLTGARSGATVQGAIQAEIQRK
jgi:hypothetical protein